MISIVVVSHSHPLAEAAVELAAEMAPDGPKVAIAAGIDGGLGTDAQAIVSAIESVDTPEGVLVLLDLGSAVLATEMAVEMLDPELAAHVKISPAPLVEGLIVAMVAGRAGFSLAEVAQEANQGLVPKQTQLAAI